MKTQRLIAIKKIIQQYKIASQEELLEKLKNIGLEYTQATLSRDLKTLRIIKFPDDDGTYIYALRDVLATDKKAKVKTAIALNGFISIAFSKQFRSNKNFIWGMLLLFPLPLMQQKFMKLLVLWQAMIPLFLFPEMVLRSQI